MDKSLAIKISSGSLLKYALPTILSNIFMNVYSLVDSLFVANLISTDALSAVSIAGPFLAIALAVGTMIATGGSALVAKQLGEGNAQEARENFSFFMIFCVFASLLFTFGGIAFREPLLHAMGSDAALYPLCEAYAIPLFIAIPFVMGAILLQIFFVAAGAPGWAFALSLAGGVTNIALDYVLIAIVPWGVAGAAWASAAGYILQSVIGVCYFAFKRNGSLYLVRPKCNFSAFVKACGNGVSEMVGMLAGTITLIAMNIILMKIVGSDGVAAGAVVLAAQSILSALYMGYAQGIAPIISFNYGGNNYENLKKLFKCALITVAGLSVLTFALAYPAAKPLALLYADGTEHVIEMSVKGIRVFAPAFLLMGFNLFASSMFTALNDGKTSGILALFRTLIFLIIPLLILPGILGVNGVWLSLPTAEILSVLMAIFYFRKMKSIYHYA